MLEERGISPAVLFAQVDRLHVTSARTIGKKKKEKKLRGHFLIFLIFHLLWFIRLLFLAWIIIFLLLRFFLLLSHSLLSLSFSIFFFALLLYLPLRLHMKFLPNIIIQFLFHHHAYEYISIYPPLHILPIYTASLPHSLEPVFIHDSPTRIKRGEKEDEFSGTRWATDRSLEHWKLSRHAKDLSSVLSCISAGWAKRKLKAFIAGCKTTASPWLSWHLSAVWERGKQRTCMRKG